MAKTVLDNQNERSVFRRGTLGNRITSIRPERPCHQRRSGFITPDGGDKDVFVHHAVIASGGFRSLAEGDRVEFQTEQGAKGPQAKDVKKI